MKNGQRVQMCDIGGQIITGTVRGAGPTERIRPLNPSEGEDIETVIVEWDDPVRASDTVAVAGLEELTE